MLNSQGHEIVCRNSKCRFAGKSGKGNIIRHGWFKVKRGRRQRYRCKECGTSVYVSTGTVYMNLQHSWKTFDDVCSMSTEGISIAAIARVKNISWNTVARWSRRAACASAGYNEKKTRGYTVTELQADELHTFVDRRSRKICVMTAICVWSRLWPSTIVGKRSVGNIKKLVRDIARNGRFEPWALITTDGFEVYGWVVPEVLGPCCVYGQVVKTWRNNRVTSVERKLKIGTEKMLRKALAKSEDSETLNTSFVERQNLTVRQGCSYLGRRTSAHARDTGRLAGSLELLRCHYNFIRPRMALKFGKLIKMPAMQAGLTNRPLTFREIFMSREARGIIFALILHGHGLDNRCCYATAA